MCALNKVKGMDLTMKKILIFVSLLLVVFITSCTNKKMFKETFMYMDTYIEIKVYGVDKKKGQGSVKNG